MRQRAHLPQEQARADHVGADVHIASGVVVPAHERHLMPRTAVRQQEPASGSSNAHCTAIMTACS
jgi:hypothetical protein